MLDQALEEACADPTLLGQEQSWKEGSVKLPSIGTPVDPGVRLRYLELGPGTAPQNVKRFAHDQIALQPGKENFETGLSMDPQLLAQYQAIKVNDFERFKELRNPQLEFTVDDLDLSELNFGRDDSGEEDLDANPEKVNFGNFDTDSMINDIKQELESA